MKLFPNQAGGQTVYLDASDALDVVPESHRDMITPAVRRVFADPAQHFLEVADRSQIPELALWLRSLVSGGDWRLLLHEGFMCDRSSLAAFHWRSTSVLSAMISLP